MLSSHSVTLTWTGTGTGFNVYRGTASGGPYSKLTPSPVNVQTYTDSAVLSGTTYYYVVTAMDPTESAYSNELLMAIPAAPALVGPTVTVTPSGSKFILSASWSDTPNLVTAWTLFVGGKVTSTGSSALASGTYSQGWSITSKSFTLIVCDANRNCVSVAQ